MSMTLEEIIKHAEYIVNNRKDAISVCWSVKDCKQIAVYLRELQERRKADSCKGCKYIGQWENEYEYGLSCPCLRCRRRVRDNYESERRK